tara:strand:+ start:87 stop:2225 length:2139 start_codon:yes stop_codon:yes gene_type:complete
MKKAEIDVVPQLTRSELDALVSEWDFGSIATHRKLYGGFSGSNYYVENAEGRRNVLKIMHGYPLREVEDVAKLQAHLAAVGFDHACSSIARAPAAVEEKGGSTYVSTSRGDDSPAMLLTFIDGKAADAVLRSSSDDADLAAALLRGVGGELAALHSLEVPAGAAALREAETDNGCCLVAQHIDGRYWARIMASPHVEGHPFVDLYRSAVEELREAMATKGLPRGICHGDPFLDNMLVDPSTGSLRGFVDFEDGAIGPLIFDIACACVAACFRLETLRGSSWQHLDLTRLRFLLEGYCAIRPFTPTERSMFCVFMRVALLCNSTWRFVQFNIDHRELKAQRNAHVELADRIEALRSDAAQRAVATCVEGAQPSNTAFCFIKPHAMNAAVETLLRARCEASSVDILAHGSLTAQEMDRRGIVDRHYGQLARRAMSVAPAELPPLAEKTLACFAEEFGVSWSDALASGDLVNVAGLFAAHGIALPSATAADSEEEDCGVEESVTRPPPPPAQQQQQQHLLADAFELERLWRSGKCVKLFPGTYCARVGLEGGQTHFVVNGFYPAMRAAWTSTEKAPHGVKWFTLSWKESVMSWTSFRNDWIGATNPAKADASSLRGVLFAKWEEVGLAKQPYGAENGFHASASPVEACYERNVWLQGQRLEDDPFLHAARCAGVDRATVEAWCSGDGMLGSEPVFDAVELFDTSAVLRAMKTSAR